MQDEHIREELERIAASNRGILCAEDVLKAAENPTNILHTWAGFEWDQKKAAFRYNLQQARGLIRTTVEYIGPENDQTLSRVFVSLSPDRTKPGGGYRSLVSVVDDDDLQQQLLQDAIRDMRRFQQRYSSLKQVSEIIRAMNSAESRIATPSSLGVADQPQATV